MAHSTAFLAGQLAQLREKNPHAYPRDFAAMLSVSEAEITPVYYGDRVQPVHDLNTLIAFVSRMPKVKLMSRVSYAVLEIFSKLDFRSENGLFVSDTASCFLALKPDETGKIYFISPEKPEEKAALLLFAKDGSAALKLYFERGEFDAALLGNPAAPGVVQGETVASALAAARLRYLGDFNPPFVAAKDAPRRLIELAAGKRYTVAFNIENNAVGVLLRHKPQKVIDARGWFNVLDPEFNLHLKEDAITRISASGDETRQMLRLENNGEEKICIYSLGEK